MNTNLNWLPLIDYPRTSLVDADDFIRMLDNLIQKLWWH